MSVCDIFWVSVCGHSSKKIMLSYEQNITYWQSRSAVKGFYSQLTPHSTNENIFIYKIHSIEQKNSKDSESNLHYGTCHIVLKIRFCKHCPQFLFSLSKHLISQIHSNRVSSISLLNMTQCIPLQLNENYKTQKHMKKQI